MNFFFEAKKHSFEDAKMIPTVCVILEGGIGTLKTVKNALKCGIPCVIVEVNFKHVMKVVPDWYLE